jgi:hypothetical protein
VTLLSFAIFLQLDRVKRLLYNIFMKGEIGKPPYTDYLVYGPILQKKEKRRLLVLISQYDPKNRTTISYARYLMATKLGDFIPDGKHVDHIDGDSLNDEINNLQILSVGDNIRKSMRPKTMVPLVCHYCNTSFVRRKGNEPSINRCKNAYCSKKCLYQSMRS